MQQDRTVSVTGVNIVNCLCNFSWEFSSKNKLCYQSTIWQLLRHLCFKLCSQNKLNYLSKKRKKELHVYYSFLTSFAVHVVLTENNWLIHVLYLKSLIRVSACAVHLAPMQYELYTSVSTPLSFSATERRIQANTLFAKLPEKQCFQVILSVCFCSSLW